MPRLEWDKTSEKLYETGVEQAALYVMGDGGVYGTGEAWNGLIGITESPSGAEATPLYANDTKYLELVSTEEYGGSIEAYTYPDGFAACNGEAELAAGIVISQQTRKTFGLVFKSLIGNDTEGTKHGYKLHLVYGARAATTEKSHQTINDSPEAATMSWEFTTTPVAVEGHEPTSHIVIDSTKVDAAKLKAIEAALYGSEEAEAKLLLPSEIVAMMAAA